MAGPSETWGPVGAPLRESTTSVHAVAWSPDGTRMASGAEDGQLRTSTQEEQAARQESKQQAKEDDGASVGSDGVPDRMKAWENAINKKMKEGASKGESGGSKGEVKGEDAPKTDAAEGSAAGALAAAGMQLDARREPSDVPPSPNYDQEYDRVMP